MNSKLLKEVTGTTKTLLALLILVISVFAASTSQIPSVHAQTPAVKVVPETLEFGPENVTGQEFVINVFIENVSDLYGIDIKFAWDPEYLAYVSHTAHIPVEDYPDGVLHEPGMFIKDDVDDVAGTYWVAYASMAPADPFDGSGIAFDIAFRIIKQPMASDPDAVITLDLVSTDLSDSGGSPIDHERNDGTVVIRTIPFEYPPIPILKVLPETLNTSTGEPFNVSVNIMGEGGVDLDPFWDVAGFDIYMHYNSTIIEALNVTIDPEGTFAGFWPGGIFEVNKTINNDEGWVYVAFLGLPGGDGNHTAPSGNFSVFSVTFNSTYEGPILSVNITLKNPKSFIHRMILHADDGLIDLTSPIDTDWTAINSYDYSTPYNLFSWTDNDGNSQLSAGDELLLNNTSNGKWHRYILYEIKGTLGPLEQQPFQAIDDYIWVADFPNEGLENCGLPGRTTGGGTAAAYNGFGNPYWTGNFTLQYPFVSVNSITVHALPFTPDEHTYTLTEGVDYIVYPDDDKIELLHPLDVNITNECWQDGVNNTLNGWPAIKYIASGIQSVYVKFPNGTERFARNLGFEQSPPAEWWYEPEWPWELEGWWALGYFSGPFNWPANSTWWINYTAASYITVDYNAEPDTRPYYVEYNGTYQEFLDLENPINTTWKEIYPNTLPTYTLVDWTDSDSSGNLTIGDYITFEGDVGNRTYLVNGLSLDIIVDQIRTVEDKDINSPFYGMPLIIELAGFPHPDYPWSPWHGSDSSPPLPHNVEGSQVVIPEYPTSLVLVLSLVASTVLVIITKPKLVKVKK